MNSTRCFVQIYQLPAVKHCADFTVSGEESSAQCFGFSYSIKHANKLEQLRFDQMEEQERKCSNGCTPMLTYFYNHCH